MGWGYGYSSSSLHFSRSRQTRFDDAWATLSARAREAFVKVIPRNTATTDSHRGVMIDEVGEEVARELEQAKLVRIVRISLKSSEVRVRVILTDDANGFSHRVKSLVTLQPYLASTDPEVSSRYARTIACDSILTRVQEVIVGAGLRSSSPEANLNGYTISATWADRVLEALKSKGKDKDAALVLKIVEEAEEPIPIPELIRKATPEATSPEALRAAIDALAEHLVIFEDLEPETFAIRVGLLPIVRVLREDARGWGKVQPLPLVPDNTVTDRAPASGLRINDLRCFLMEVLTSPPSVRQDGEIFQKDLNRIAATLVPWPNWLQELLHLKPTDRVDQAVDFAEALQWIDLVEQSNSARFHLTDAGRLWLDSPPNRQYETLYGAIRKESLPPDRGGLERSRPFIYSYHDFGPISDELFLGVRVVVEGRPRDKNGKPTHWRSFSYGNVTPQPGSFQKIRDVLMKAFDRLPESGFVRLEEFVKQLAKERPCPLLLGQELPNVTIWLDGESYPQIEDALMASWAMILLVHMRFRLISLDAVEVARTASGEVVVARTPRLAAFYGKAKLKDEPVAHRGASVIVQPDFSVTVIGLETGPAAILATFCDRVQGHTGTGALTFKLTRDSIRRAVTQSGLDGPTIVKQLRSLATKELPANVAREVGDWANWVRKVNADPVILIRCPDPDATARVVAALGKRAERLNEHHVAVNLQKLAAAERQKLLSQGIVITKDRVILSSEPASGEPPAPKKAAAKASASKTSATKTPAPASAPKKRGRPKKAK